MSALVLVGCSEDSETASLRALEPAGEASVVCLGRDANGSFTRGVERSACPKLGSVPDNEELHLHALVTQPASGEVALVDLEVSANDAVVDFEPTQPGYSFMPVGAEPVSIVSTPGGIASFVAVREPGKEGIFGLPSSCIGARPASAPIRDIRTWPACRLPAAPGPMVLLNDPAIDHDTDASTPGRLRGTCDAEYVEADQLVGQAPAAGREQCPADLATEAGSPGRRKLAVTLPSLGQIWVLDAQELLDRAPGSFDPCNFEHRLALQAEPSDAQQPLPADLVPSSPSCAPVGFNHGPVPDSFRPWPVDLALDDQQRLYVADSEAPVVHVIDVSDPCALSPLPPLEPRSYTDPNAVVTTRRVAVSPLTPLGKRFVYAVDNSATLNAGSLMIFDVSPGSTQRTPLIRERSPFNPNEPPDRISLSRDVADVEFVFQDSPEPDDGIAIEGVACDPDPSLPSERPEAQYRPSPDLSSGAAPGKLRGTFAFAALHSGQIAIVDVEDLDGACRRPASLNPGPAENIFGCKNDDSEVPGYVNLFFDPTVSNELSCNVVAPHRVRSRAFFTNETGAARSAGLVGFPTLTLETGRSVTTDQSSEGRDQPKMLAARHAAGQSSELSVGPIAYDTDVTTSNRLEVDPERAERSSLLLSYEEPRAFSPSEDFTSTYEGLVRAGAQAILSVDEATGLGVINEGLNASFCAAGIQDLELTRGVALDLGVSSSVDQTAFARRHADYAQLVGALLESNDAYWNAPNAGAECGRELYQNGTANPTTLSGRALCEQFFGSAEVPEVNRDFRILEASEDRLVVEPRSFEPTGPTRATPMRRRLLLEFASCCFPEPTPFQVRAGHQWVVRGSATGVPHRVTADPITQRCVADCSPLVQKRQGRAFEISCSENCSSGAIGLAVPGEDFACVVDGAEDGIDPGEAGSECIFQNLTTRFAVYRGQLPSARDMRFRWQLADGFTPLTISLTSNVDRTPSAPRSLLLIPELNELLVTDGSRRGITLVLPRRPGFTVSIF